MYNIEVTIREGINVWRQNASVRKGQFNGSPYCLFDDLMVALNGHRDPAFLIEYATIYFNKQTGKLPFTFGKASGV